MIKARGDVLRTMSREQLITAGQQLTETWHVEGRPATVSVIVERLDDGSLRVVVQGFMPAKWFGQHVALAKYAPLRPSLSLPHSTRREPASA